jgi:CheY-like chemotaxis protein
MNEISRFLIIDDDPVNNALCHLVINFTSKSIEVKTFNTPEKGLEYISSQYPNGSEKKTVILLDINMPTMSGWEFLDHFSNLQDKIKKQLKIYILSSSVDVRDKKRASNNKYITDYIVKPLTFETVENICKGRSLEKYSDY